ncbi:hypothetical protein glysoja_040380 [Glycine soja]|uniref:Uncharacterized protein n=1 Tax=Glycine soja TaxID=3848 RepID=A0A0B2PWF5_GLYSO|nr:hypothetical protein glysoja_040380 [Glycine soja]
MDRNDLYRSLRENFRRLDRFWFYVEEVSCRKMQFASEGDYPVAESSCCMDTITLLKGRMAKPFMYSAKAGLMPLQLFDVT